MATLNVDNIKVNGNTISSTDTDGDINLTPDGTGSVVASKADINGGTIDGTTIGGTTPAAGTFTQLQATGRSYKTGYSSTVIIAASAIDNWVRIALIEEGVHKFRIAGSGSSNYHGADFTVHLNYSSSASGSDHPGVNVSSLSKDENFTEFTDIYAEFVSSNSAYILVKIRGNSGGVNNYVFDVEGLSLSTGNALAISQTTSDPGLTALVPNIELGESVIKFGVSEAEAMRIDSSRNLKFDSGYGSVATAYGCRAWVNFNGTGTVAIRESGNVSSITDNGGNGDYTVNFTTAMPDVNYCVAMSSDQSAAGSGNGVVARGSAVNATTSKQVETVNMSGTRYDASSIFVSIFR